MSKRDTPWISDKPPVALIAGPTASGKTGLGIALAKALEDCGTSSAVINADSAQVYADLRILSARPDKEEMDGVPHLLFGEWDGAKACSAADWALAAKRKIAAAHASGAVPILVGGTGLYLRTLLDGIAPVPDIDPGIRETVRALDQNAARAALEVEDPVAAKRIAAADRTRTLRALEVVRSTGQTLGQWQREKTGGIVGDIALHPLILLPEREWLYERCDRRFAMMLESGARDEVASLLARNLDPSLPVMRAIGVAEVTAWISEKITRQICQESGQMATRQYAKRQYTWFRNQPPGHWRRTGQMPDVHEWATRILSS